MTETQEKIANSLRRYPGKNNAAIAKNFRGIAAGDVQIVRDLMGDAVGAAGSHTMQSYNLRGKRVVSRRPAESAAKYIKRLPTGQGFDPKNLAQEWGMSEETVRKHARDMGCLKYVEVSEDEWVALVLNPETAKHYSI